MHLPCRYSFDEVLERRLYVVCSVNDFAADQCHDGFYGGNLFVGDCQNVLGQHCHIRELAWFDGTSNIFLEAEVGSTCSEDPQCFKSAQSLLRSQYDG